MAYKKTIEGVGRTRRVSLKKLCFAALFAAITCIGTFISVPLPIGYFNLGDIFVLSGALLIGPVWGAVAAGLGSALADIFMGFVAYAPATFVIKALVAATAVTVFSAFERVAKRERSLSAWWLVCAVLAECVMVGGYFFYEAVVLGYGLGAVASLPGNCVQGICGALGAFTLRSVVIKRFHKGNGASS